MAASLKQTMDDARKAMSAFAENMEALKHNFLVRGFFKDRGFFNLADDLAGGVPPGRADEGRPDADRRACWLKAAVLFEPAPDEPADRAADRRRQGAARRGDRRLSRPRWRPAC